ncbi:MAG: IS1634 family transposase [Euryarchaeota archaeon]|nr:IS1634 family transposase [Euryarchaeota archaeon]
MTFLYRKHQSGQDYWYIRKTARVDGESRTVINIYLGTADQILNHFKSRSRIPDELELSSYSFGTSAAVLAADKELGFSDIVSESAGSRSTALALLAFIAGRSEKPVSKNGMDEWYEESLLKMIIPDMPDLSTRSYLRYMDRLTPECVADIKLKLAMKMVSMGYKPSLVFFDLTNFSTEQQPDLDDSQRTLSRCGHPKNGDFQAKLVGLATASTDQHLPVFHEVYPGNMADVTLFSQVIESMINQLLKLGTVADDLIFVFDKGVNSEDNLAELADKKVHFVSSLKRVQVSDLVERPLSSFKKLYVTANGEEILGFRVNRKVMGIDGVIVVSYNDAARRRQRIDYRRARKRFLNGGKEIATNMSKKHRGRKSTVQSVTERIEDLLPKKWRGVFKYHVGATLDDGFTKFTVRAWVDKKKEKSLKSGFGKTIIFTDKSGWTDERIVRTYLARSGMEEDYHVLKDVLLFPVMPIFHRIDDRIRVHTFLCVIGLLFYRFIQLRLEEKTKVKLPIERMVEELDRLRVAAVTMGPKNDVRFVLEKRRGVGNDIVKALDLQRFVPN